MILLYWYLVIGVLIGCVMTYALVRVVGWDEMLKDYNSSYALEERFDFKIETFKTILCLLMPLVVSFTWPYFVYLFSKKYFK